MPTDTLEAITARVETLEGQVKEVFDRLNDKDCGPTVLNSKLNSVLLTLGEVKQAVTALQNVPARKWDTLIMAIASAIIAAAVGYIFK
jgi:predicted negative regulator of RcsB-dependent stress response